jgi:hypothetical protein
VAGPDGEFTLAFDAALRECALPPGKYRVRTTRIVRENWIISSAAGPEPALVVKDPRQGRARMMDVAETARLEVPGSCGSMARRGRTAGNSSSASASRARTGAG